jgi:hypothetical protein
VPATPTLRDLQAAATEANTRLGDANRRLEQARVALITASAAHHEAIVALTAPAIAPPPGPPVAKAAAVRAAAAQAEPDAIRATGEQLEKALADYQQVSRDLGLS